MNLFEIKWNRDLVASRLATLRDASGLLDVEVAKAIGVSPATVRSWEKGRESPKNWAIARLALLYEVSADYILGIKKGLPYGWDEKADHRMCRLIGER